MSSRIVLFPSSSRWSESESANLSNRFNGRVWSKIRAVNNILDDIEFKGDTVGFQEFFEMNQWKVVDVLETELRQSELLTIDDLSLAPASRAYLEHAYPSGIYRHQKLALNQFLSGESVCLVTGTASGKSLVFQTAALDIMARDPEAKIMAIYPMKALGNEQHDRWQKALAESGLGGADSDSLIGRIDGNVPPGFRLSILERAKVIVFTPDIIHAWLFSNLSQPAVINFLKHVKLIVVDEVHAYSGVFGSNAAFLFRRLQHLLNLLGASPKYICASATIAQPQEHLQSLFGQTFRMIGPEADTSPRYPLKVYLADPPGSERFLDEVVHLLESLTHQSGSRFIAFVDSRKQVELISSILNRLLRESEKEAAQEENAGGESAGGRPTRGRRWGSKSSTKSAADLNSDEPDLEGEVTGVLQNLNVVPYRAGYEDHDRRQIQDRLAEGTLNGVVSTSALELGIDIPHLDTCVLIGVPSSSTSLQQRIGRIGRHGPGDVIVVNGGDVHDQTVFSHPQSFFDRPLAESMLYLENEHIQYIHSLCLARRNGEHDQVSAAMGQKDGEFRSTVHWPENFLTLCEKERSGKIPRHLTNLKMESGEHPNYTFPLRDVESQFKVERRDGPNVSSMGSLSFGQLMREAYPGAIYYYATIPYRVTKVNVKAKVVTVRREKRYTTQPQRMLPAVFPRLSPGGVYSAIQQDALIGLETNLLVRESIRGVVEQRGRTETIYPYPLAREWGFYQEQPFFSRNYFTTGVVLSHPALAAEGVNIEAAAAILYEAFMLTIPFERQDIGYAADHFRVQRGTYITEEQPFIAIFDQTYGSLRLSTRLLAQGMLAQVLGEAFLLARRQENLVSSPATMEALKAMARDAFVSPLQQLGFRKDNSGADRDPLYWERVVVPGSKGLMVRTNEEFHVVRILTTPAGLSYEGIPASMVGSGASMMPLTSDVAEVPGESTVGWYEIQTGQIEPAESGEAAELYTIGDAEPAPEPNQAWMEHALAMYFDDAAITRLLERYSLSSISAEDRSKQILALVKVCDPASLLDAYYAIA